MDDFQSNPFGLYQVHGNVWEWIQDSWHENYRDAPTDGSAWEESGYGGPRVLRGGSWNSEPGGLRSAARIGYYPLLWTNDWGFRLARTLTL